MLHPSTAQLKSCLVWFLGDLLFGLRFSEADNSDKSVNGLDEDKAAVPPAIPNSTMKQHNASRSNWATTSLAMLERK